jgi:hypothetical protein
LYVFFWVFPRRQIDAGEIPKRIHTIFKARRKFEIKKYIVSVFHALMILCTHITVKQEKK